MAGAWRSTLAGRAGRELTDNDLNELLVLVGLGPADTDFKALPQWDFWSPCRQAISWGGELVTRSAAAGIEGFERLETPTLLVRGRSTTPWLGSVVDILAREMPDATLTELDGGHACLLESPQEFLAAVAGHIESRLRPAPLLTEGALDDFGTGFGSFTHLKRIRRRLRSGLLRRASAEDHLADPV